VERQYPTLGGPDDGARPAASDAELRPLRSRLGLRPRRRPSLNDNDDMPHRRRTPRRIALWILLGVLAITVLPVLVLAVVPAWTSSFMVGYQIERLTSEKKLPPLEHDWVSWEEIAPAAKLAVIAAEDQRFAEHFGFDLEAIGKAVQHNRNHRRKRGASTISQQVAKNLFLWSGRSWTRKAFEVGFTLLIETLWSKQRVLEMYLNVAEFGPGVYGVEAASLKYFRKPASKLTYPEAALLAAVLPNPKRLRVEAPSTYVQQRAGWILGQMYHLGPAVVNQL
jgi:monofunctional biosynthetic peptidoglycan transglycosylase